MHDLRVLSRSGPVTLWTCPSGDCLHLSLGPVTIRVSRDALRHLHDAVADALAARRDPIPPVLCAPGDA